MKVTIIICIFLIIGICQACTGQQVQVTAGFGSTGCVYPKQLILNCIAYYYDSMRNLWSCTTCDSSITPNPNIGMQQVKMFNYQTTDNGATFTLSSSSLRKACQPSSQFITDCIGYYMYDATTYHCKQCAQIAFDQYLKIPLVLTNSPYPQCVYGTVVTNCIQYESTTPYLCTACIQGYTLVNLDDGTSGCVLTSAIISGCLQYRLNQQCDSATFLCILCQGDLNPVIDLDTNIVSCSINAESIISNCKTLNMTGNHIKCVQCLFGWILNYEQNSCIKLVFGCTTYKSGVCQICQSPYTLLNNTCLTPPSNCLRVNSTTNLCLKCSTGFVANLLGNCQVDWSCSNYMERDPISNACVNGTIPNCKVYNLDGTCFECDLSYQKDSLGFTCNFNLIPIVCSNDPSTLRYAVISGICIKVDANCLYYLPSGYCYWCRTNFSAFQGLCFNESQQNPINNSGVGGAINICSQGYYSVGVNCIPIPAHCSSFNSIRNICEFCSEGFIPFNNLCVKSIVCPTNFYSNGVQCVSIDPNCVSFNYQTTVCDVCITNYTPSGPNCISNLITLGQCPNNRTWNGPNGRCIGISQTCATFDKQTGECFTCFTPFQIVFPSLCGLKLSENPQFQCPSGTVRIANKACVPEIKHCKSYQKQRGYCLSCIQTYQIDPISHTCNLIS